MRVLMPTGLATGIFMTGLSVFSSLLYSSSIVWENKAYGPVGVVMVLISYLVGLGVVIHLGAVVGRLWNERHSPDPGDDLRGRRTGPACAEGVTRVSLDLAEPCGNDADRYCPRSDDLQAC